MTPKLPTYPHDIRACRGRAEGQGRAKTGVRHSGAKCPIFRASVPHVSRRREKAEEEGRVDYLQLIVLLAEGVRFELTVPLPARRISSPVH